MGHWQSVVEAIPIVGSWLSKVSLLFKLAGRSQFIRHMLCRTGNDRLRVLVWLVVGRDEVSPAPGPVEESNRRDPLKILGRSILCFGRFPYNGLLPHPDLQSSALHPLGHGCRNHSLREPATRGSTGISRRQPS